MKRLKSKKETMVFPATTQAPKDTPDWKKGVPSYDRSIQGHLRRKERRGKKKRGREREREKEKRRKEREKKRERKGRWGHGDRRSQLRNKRPGTHHVEGCTWKGNQGSNTPQWAKRSLTALAGRLESAWTRSGCTEAADSFAIIRQVLAKLWHKPTPVAVDASVQPEHR